MAEVAEQLKNPYEYILSEESNFRTGRVPLATNWRDWNMYEHVDRSFTLKNSRFYKGNQDYTRPFLNIILPIANVSYRSEGFDVKDVELYVDNQENYHKSFVARKFHNWWAKENQIDTAIDESVESYFDYGLAVVKNVGEVKPEVVQLQQIAFCDQTDFMSGPRCLAHYMAVDELMAMKGKWDEDAIRTAILMSQTQKEVDAADEDNVETPGKYVKVYELEGVLPESWLGPEKMGEEWEDTGDYTLQTHIVTYFTSPEDNKTQVGITLFKGKRDKSIFKALVRDPIHGRACGRGGIEELFHPQIWANYSMYHITQMLETTSKVILTTNKKNIVSLNDFSNIKQGQILDVGDDGRLDQLPLQPINKAAFDGNIEKWEQVSRGIGSASDPQLGMNPVSGTPLGTTEIVTSQGQGIHEYRRGKVAEFWQDVYREWVLPHLQREINKGHKWLDELSLGELQELAERISTKRTNQKIKERLLSSKQMLSKQEVEEMRGLLKQQVMQGGEKRFIEIVKDEFDDLPMDIQVNIANKDVNTAEMLNKLNSVFRTVFTPGALQAIQQNEGLGELLNEILETAGLSPVNFANVTNQQEQPMQQLMQPPGQQPGQQQGIAQEANQVTT